MPQKEFYRQGVDIFDASTNQRITQPDWEANWTGRATEVGAATSGAQAFTEATGTAPANADDFKAIEEFNKFPETALDEQAQQAQQSASSYNPSMMLQVLKQGMRLKQDPSKIDAGLPTSLMKRAGLPTSGKDAAPILFQALDMQRGRIQKSTAEVTKYLESANSIFRDQAAIIRDDANRITNQQNILRERAFQLDDEQREMDQKIDLLRMQDEMERKMFAYRESFDTSGGGSSSGIGGSGSNPGDYTDQELRKLRASNIDPLNIEEADNFLYPVKITDENIIEAMEADIEANTSTGDIISILQSQGKDPFSKKFWPYTEKAIINQIQRGIDNGMTEKEIRQDLRDNGLSDDEIDQFKKEIDKAPNKFTRMLGF